MSVKFSSSLLGGSWPVFAGQLDEESFISPPSSPVRADRSTPISLSKRKLSQIEPDADLTGRELSTVEQGISKIQKMQDTPGGSKSRAARETAGILQERLVESHLSPVSASTTLAARLREAPNLAQVARRLEFADADTQHKAEELPRPMQAIDYSHILEAKVTGNRALGWHFCPLDHEERHLLQDVLYSINGVFCASFSKPAGRPLKRSSFFPEYVADRNALHEIIQDAVVIMRSKNRFLCSTHREGLYIEKYMDKGVITKTAFPVFAFETWEADKEFTLTENFSISGSDLLKIANDNMLDPMYKDGENVVLDFGTRLVGLNVHQGIYFIFPSNVLKYEFFED